RASLAIPRPSTVHGEVTQPRHLGVPGAHRVGRQLRRHELQVEREFLAVRGSTGYGTRVRREQCCHLLARPQVCRAGGGQPAIHLVETAPGAYGGERGGERSALGRRVVHIPGRHGRQAKAVREGGERVAQVVVERITAPGQLDGDVVVSEHADETVEFSG